MPTLTVAQFDEWLKAYKAAWETRDPAAAAALFTADVAYHWTPYDPPQLGRAAITAAWEGAVHGQKDVRFRYEVLAVEGMRGIAHWNTRLTSVPAGESVELDGIFVVEFEGPGLCQLFREWWHVRSKAA